MRQILRNLFGPFLRCFDLHRSIPPFIWAIESSLIILVLALHFRQWIDISMRSSSGAVVGCVFAILLVWVPDASTQSLELKSSMMILLPK